MIKNKIRSATSADLTALVTLEKECFESDIMPHESYRRLLNGKSAAILAATHEKKIIGSAVILFRANSSKARIYSFAVHKDHRARGIAGDLCAAAERLAKRRCCTVLQLEVRPDNIPARRFYEKKGYTVFGTYPEFYEDGSEALRMLKNL
jgi:ribosomal-protein-alanine N-acetyltransferase